MQRTPRPVFSQKGSKTSLGINDIFAGKGITEYVYTSGNAEGITRTLEYLDKDFEGLCFVNLVDYDMLYGHRRDVAHLSLRPLAGQAS